MKDVSYTCNFCLFAAIVDNIERLPLNHPVTCLNKLAHFAEQVMGGTSGAVYSLMFVGASVNVPNWAAAWQSGLDTIMKYSSARLGHRTMVRCKCIIFKANKN